MEELIKFKKVKKTYQVGEKNFNALDGVDFSINKGEFVVILGPSGAGKSTLLNLLGGMDKATSGDIIIGEEKISKYNDEQLTKYRAENVGFIFQFYNILPTLTVLENVEIVQDIVKKPKSTKKILKEVGLGKHYNKFPNQLSGGEQQRVSIARAIAKDPLLLLCDEPTGALDYKTSKEILKLMEDVNKKYGNTIVMVTHNDAIKNMADRVVKMRDGQIRDNYKNKSKTPASELEW